MTAAKLCGARAESAAGTAHLPVRTPRRELLSEGKRERLKARGNRLPEGQNTDTYVFLQKSRKNQQSENQGNGNEGKNADGLQEDRYRFGFLVVEIQADRLIEKYETHHGRRQDKERENGDGNDGAVNLGGEFLDLIHDRSYDDDIQHRRESVQERALGHRLPIEPLSPIKSFSRASRGEG